MKFNAEKNKNFRVSKKLEFFPEYNRLSFRKYFLPEGGKKRKKTIYTEEGFPRWLNLETGEIDYKDTSAIVKSLSSSITRAKKKFRDLLHSNAFEWFGVLTFDPKKVNSFDLDECYKAIDLFRRKMATLCPEFYMLLVPELHESGRYHFHVLLSDLDKEKAGLRKNGKVCCHFLPKGSCNKEFYLKHYQNSKNKIPTDGADCYSLDAFKFGFTSFTRIVNMNKARSYLMKYMSKAFGQIGKNRKKFVHTKNMNQPVTMRVEILDIFNEDIAEVAKRELEASKVLKKANDEVEIHYENEKWAMMEFYDYNPKMKEKTLMEFAKNAFESELEEMARASCGEIRLRKYGVFTKGNKRFEFEIKDGKFDLLFGKLYDFFTAISEAQSMINKMQRNGKKVTQMSLGDLAHA